MSVFPALSSMIKMSNIASSSKDQIQSGQIPKLKQQKLEEKLEITATNSNRDIISTLPDSLLCHILSFLPTRSSIATSILSRRWRHLWKDLQVLDLVDGLVVEPYHVPGHSDEEVKESFSGFLNTVLSKFHHIQKFRLSCFVHDHDALSSWINAVIGPHLQELYLKLWSFEFRPRLPCGVFTCTSLVSLTLESDTFQDDLPSVHLPSLKYLKLDIGYVNLEKLLSGCPSLETLEVDLYLDLYNNPEPQAFHMPHSLKRLTFWCYVYNGTLEHLEIDTPSLEYLDIQLHARCLGILVSNFPKMVEAHLDIDIDIDPEVNVDWVPEVLKALCKTRSLVLENSTTECLLMVNAAPILHFNEFCCLCRLQIKFPYFNSRFLLDLLHNCHRLQVLLIDNSYYRIDSSEQSNWTQPINVPNCVTSHLNIVEFSGYQHTAEEHGFTAYILQRGLVLKAMMIHTHTSSRFEPQKKDYILKELSIVSRGSRICQLSLD